MTEVEYLRLSEESNCRYEYLDGEAIEKVGGSFRHNLITMNIRARLWEQVSIAVGEVGNGVA